MATSSPGASDALAVSTTQVREEDLRFDDKNPRFSSGDAGATQDELLRILWRDYAVDEIALSIAANGFFQYEPLFAAEEDGRLIVVEGNRRLAAVRLLRHASMRRAVGATDLPEITPQREDELSVLPVILTARDNIWQYIGFKHVNGPQAWQSFSKAQYIAWVHNDLEVSLEDIARHIGDRHATVRRLYRGLMVLEQAESEGVFTRDDRWKNHFSFSHLYTGLDYPGIRRYIGLTSARDYTARPVPPSKLKPLGDLCVWLFGSKSRSIRPVVESQNPDLRNLDEVLQSSDGTAALRRGLPLSLSLDISKGDERLFREALVSAKASLQEARGKLLTGFSGEVPLLRTAEEISELAENVLLEMQQTRRRSRSRTRTDAKR